MAVERLVHLLESGVGSVFPSAVAVVHCGGDVVFEAAVGNVALNRRSEIDTLYDLASLTKPMATCSVVWWALAQQKISLEQSVGRVLFPGNKVWHQVTVRHLIGHAAGLPAWRDVGGDWNSSAFSEFLRSPGEDAVYSDLGYMALGRFLELELGASLEELLDRVTSQFNLDGATFRPSYAAPTGICQQRGEIRCQVHDPNAYALGGICGHAGLFASARVVANWGQSILRWRSDVRSPLGAVIRECWAGKAAINPTSWHLGLDSVSPGISSAGNYFGPDARGHLGYTGTSIWLEPQQQVVVALLTNRVHPLDVSNPEIKRFRPKFHDVVAEIFFR